MMLHTIFDSYGSDRDSEYIIRHYDFEQLKQRQRANYQYLLDHMPEHPKLTVIFPVLKKALFPATLPCAEDRDMVQSYLASCPASRPPLWPQGPMVDTETMAAAAYIYSHVLSFTYDQRYRLRDGVYLQTDRGHA